MRLSSHRVLAALALAAGIGGAPAAALGQGAILDEDEAAPAVSAQATAEPSAKLGLGLRLRQVYLPESLLELFVEDAAGGGEHFGFGLEFIREKGNFAFILGVEYESLAATDGLWLDKGDQIPQDEPDFIEFEDFGWVGVDITFMWQTRLTRMLSLRYGAGIGLGVILGEVLRSDRSCPGDELDPAVCGESPAPTMPDRTAEDDIPPVFPIVNMVVGLQFRPIENVAVNFEGGIRTVPFLGTSVAYLF